MKNPVYTKILLTSLVAPFIFQGEAALAQESAEQAPSQSGAPAVDEIIVTAQRRSQSVLSVPQSLSASSGEQLAKSGIQTLTDLQFTTPGYLPTESSGSLQIFIRGIGNSVLLGADPSVATFIDDVPRIYGTTTTNLVDVERIEILKGAPGGLYGRNATGGAVNVITYQPTTDAFMGRAKVSYGEKKTFKGSLYLNLPISENIALTIGGQRETHAPYTKNITTDPAPYTAAMFPGGSLLGTAAQTAAILNSGVTPLKGYGNQDFWAVSSKLLLRASDNFKITLAGDFNRKEDSNGTQFYNQTPEVAQANLTGTLNGFIGANVALPPGFMKGRAGKFTVAGGTKGFVDLDDYGGSVTAVLSLPTADVTSITAYRGQRHENIADLTATTVPTVFAHGIVKKHFFYQEVRAVSTGTGPLSLSGGATYLRSYYKSDVEVSIIPPVLSDLPIALSEDRITAWSVYAQADYALTSNLNVSASGRFVHEKNVATYISPVSPSSNFVQKKFLPSLTLNYELDDGGTAYIRWARGFKAGGVNPLSPPSVFPDPTLGGTFKGESVDAYEIGLRAPLLDRRIQLTTAIFYNDYTNLQTSGRTNAANANILLAIVNAGAARTWGAEGSVIWRVSDPLTVNVSAGYLNAKFKKFAVTDTTVYVPFDLSGETMFNAPKLQASVSADLDQPLNDQFHLVAHGLVSHTSRFRWGLSGLPGFLPDPVEDGYWITNLRLGLRTSDDKYGVAVYANNLFNTGYSVFGSSAAANGTIIEWGNPRIVGAEVSVRF